MPHIKRTSGTLITETQIGKDYSNNCPEFLQSTYVGQSNGSQSSRIDLSILKRDYSAGLSFEIIKFGEKRNTSLSVEVGLDELNIMIEFFNQIRDQMKNYAGDVKIIKP